VLNCIVTPSTRSRPTLMVYPDEATARENSQDRVQPMIRRSPPFTAT